MVDDWLAVPRDVDDGDVETLEFLVNQIPDGLFYEIGDVGGQPIVHNLYAPIIASLERDGFIEWTGGYRGGRKIYRATSAGSDRT